MTWSFVEVPLCFQIFSTKTYTEFPNDLQMVRSCFQTDALSGMPKSVFIILYSKSTFFLNLTYCSRETCKRVVGKQCRPRSEAAERGV